MRRFHLGVIDNDTRSVLLMSSLFRCFVLVAVTAENPASHRIYHFFLPKKNSSLPHVAGTPSLSSSRTRAPHTARLASAISSGRGPMSDLRRNQSSQVTQLGSSPTGVHSARLASAVLQSYCPCPAAQYHLIHGPVLVRGPGVGEHGSRTVNWVLFSDCYNY